MKISTTHQKFANDLNDQTALECPEYFLGPNWKDVLNFWLYLDTLHYEVLRLIDMRYYTLGEIGTLKKLSWNVAKDTIGLKYADAAWHASPTLADGCATCELIGSHNLKSLNFLPLFLNL